MLTSLINSHVGFEDVKVILNELSVEIGKLFRENRNSFASRGIIFKASVLLQSLPPLIDIDTGGHVPI